MAKDDACGVERRGTGMILGKFLPPHLGHQYLVDFARNFVHDLTVMVCSIKAEPIAGELRHGWMREMCPQHGVRVVHHTDEIPQSPEEHPDFWRIWHDAIRRFIPTGPDFVFASEPYGQKLADTLGARFVPVDLGRTLVPTSGTAVRTDPMRNWEYIPACVRPHFVKRVCVFGPESTGKTTLARDLAAHYKTVWASEWARALLDPNAGRCEIDDIPMIVRGQTASEDALARQANRVLFCDTDPLTTCVWSDVLFGRCDEAVRREAQSRRYDLYLLCDTDVEWVDDSTRYLGHMRREFFERCRDALESSGREYVVVRGSWEERFRLACEAVDGVLGTRNVSAE